MTVATQIATPVPEVVYHLGNGETVTEPGEKAAANLAGFFLGELDAAFKRRWAEASECVRAGDYAGALKVTDALRMHLGEYMHKLARAVAASGVDPVKLLQEFNESYVTPHGNDYIPPCVPALSPDEHDYAEQVERIEKLPATKQDAARQKLEARDEKAWAKFDRERKRYAGKMALDMALNLWGYPEYMALIKAEGAAMRETTEE